MTSVVMHPGGDGKYRAETENNRGLFWQPVELADQFSQSYLVAVVVMPVPIVAA